jgi:spore coat protein U-like protein
MKTLMAALLLAALWLGGNGAHAQTCTVSMTPITFPNFNPVLGASVTQTGTLTATCTWGLLTPGYARVCVNLGIGGGSTVQDPRQMANGVNRLQYRLSPNSSMSPLWGSAANGSTPVIIDLTQPLLGSQATVNQPITGQILSGHDRVLGNFHRRGNLRLWILHPGPARLLVADHSRQLQLHGARQCDQQLHHFRLPVELRVDG